MTTLHILTLTCDDRPGLVHAVCGGLLDVGGNIVENAQFTEPDTNTFCMRTLVETPTDDPTTVADAVAARLDDPTAALHVRRESHRPIAEHGIASLHLPVTEDAGARTASSASATRPSSSPDTT